MDQFQFTVAVHADESQWPDWARAALAKPLHEAGALFRSWKGLFLETGPEQGQVTILKVEVGHWLVRENDGTITRWVTR